MFKKLITPTEQLILLLANSHEFMGCLDASPVRLVQFDLTINLTIYTYAWPAVLEFDWFGCCPVCACAWDWAWDGDCVM